MKGYFLRKNNNRSKIGRDHCCAVIQFGGKCFKRMLTWFNKLDIRLLLSRTASLWPSKLRSNHRMSHRFWSEAYFRLALKAVFRPTPGLLSCHTRCSRSLKQVINGLLTWPISPHMLSDYSASAIRTSQPTFKETEREVFYCSQQ